MTKQIFRYMTQVSENGTISLPKMTSLASQQVEVTIRPAPEEKEKNLPQLVDEFIENWGGILQGHDPERLKNAYLMEKYGQGVD